MWLSANLPIKLFEKCEVESMEMPEELTAWDCHHCKTWNEPRTLVCKNCCAHRYTDSESIPSIRWSRRYHRIMKLLDENKELGMTLHDVVYLVLMRAGRR